MEVTFINKDIVRKFCNVGKYNAVKFVTPDLVQVGQYLIHSQLLRFDPQAYVLLEDNQVQMIVENLRNIKVLFLFLRV